MGATIQNLKFSIQNSYVIGVDIGTTNTKAIAFTERGEILGSVSASYPTYSDGTGRHELDPDQLLGAVLRVLADLGRQTAGKDRLAGISFSCAMHSLIVVDAAGCPLTRASTWADIRSEAFARALKTGETGRRIYRQTGTPIHPMSPLSKLLWMREKEPAIFGRAARFISIKEYIWWRLFGEYEIDHSIASATGLFDIYKKDWYTESLELAGIHAGQLSRPVPCTWSRTGLLPAYRDELGLPEGLPFIIGSSDGCLANLGTNAVKPGATALTIGTSGAVRMTSTQPAYDQKERIFNYILSEGLYVSGGATNNGGNVVQWYVGNFLESGAMGAAGGGANTTASGPLETRDIARMVARADEAAPGCEGLIFLPYLLGERAPVWNGDAKGVFFGIRHLHNQSHFIRSVMEGVSYSLYQIGVSLEETVGPIEYIYASGGFTHSATWLQMIADVFGKKLYVTGVADASAVGAAIMGMYALGITGDLAGMASLLSVTATYEPDRARHRVYQENFRVFLTLYDRLKDLM
ncbi:MAG TPA: gluconokinase [Puia sp.]|nr:gluconokinase [Puia sp.]